MAQPPATQAPILARPPGYPARQGIPPPGLYLAPEFLGFLHNMWWGLPITTLTLMLALSCCIWTNYRSHRCEHDNDNIV